MVVSRKETEELRYYASMVLKFDPDDPEIETWITMPDVLAIKYPSGLIDLYYYFGESIRRYNPIKENTNDWFKEVSMRIRYYIYRKGLYQNEFANRLGISKDVLNRYLNGKNIPSAYMLYRIAEVLDISLDDLVVFDRDINEYVD